MHNPPHPGEILRDGVFADTGISVTDFAQRLGVTRVALSRVLNGKAAISAEMAVRLAAALGGSATTWLHLQANLRRLASGAGAEAGDCEDQAIGRRREHSACGVCQDKDRACRPFLAKARFAIRLGLPRAPMTLDVI